MVDVVKAVKKGFDRGEKDFGVKARSIVCMIRGMDKKFPQMILDLGEHRRGSGQLRVTNNCSHEWQRSRSGRHRCSRNCTWS